MRENNNNNDGSKKKHNQPTLTTSASDDQVEQITKQLNKLIEVVKLVDLTDGDGPGPFACRVHAAVRQVVDFTDTDRGMGDDIARASQALRDIGL